MKEWNLHTFERTAAGFTQFRVWPKLVEGSALYGPLFLPDMITDLFQVTEIQ